MSLTDRVIAARNALADLANYESMVAEADKYGRRAGQLSAPAARLVKQARIATHLSAGGVPVCGLEPLPLSHWRGILDTLRRAVVESPVAVLDPRPGHDARKAFIEPLERLPDEIELVLVASWRQWLEELAPGINNEELELLASVPTLRADVAEIMSIRRRLALFGQTLPETVDTIESARAFGEEISRRWRELTGVNIPVDAIRFLRAAGAREGAGYALLTSEALGWLRDHNLLDKLKIRLS